MFFLEKKAGRWLARSGICFPDRVRRSRERRREEKPKPSLDSKASTDSPEKGDRARATTRKKVFRESGSAEQGGEGVAAPGQKLQSSGSNEQKERTPQPMKKSTGPLGLYRLEKQKVSTNADTPFEECPREKDEASATPSRPNNEKKKLQLTLACIERKTARASGKLILRKWGPTVMITTVVKNEKGRRDWYSHGSVPTGRGYEARGKVLRKTSVV